MTATETSTGRPTAAASGPRRARSLPAAWLLGTALAGCEAPPPPAASSATSSAAPAGATSGAPGEVVFDPKKPPPGWTLCHRNHCHHQDGRVASYAQVMKEMGATRVVGEEAPKAAPPAPADVAAAPADAEKSSSGLVTKVVKAGSGTRKPDAASVVTVHYTGWTPDGKAFDSSITRNQPAQFPLSRVMPGWREGIQLMVEGEERRFWVPQELAFNGAAGKPTGMVVFDIELIGIQ